MESESREETPIAATPRADMDTASPAASDSSHGSYDSYDSDDDAHVMQQSVESLATEPLPRLPFNIDRIRRDTATRLDQAILTVLGQALQSTERDVERAGAQAAAALDELCPSLAYLQRRDGQPDYPVDFDSATSSGAPTFGHGGSASESKSGRSGFDSIFSDAQRRSANASAVVPRVATARVRDDDYDDNDDDDDDSDGGYDEEKAYKTTQKLERFLWKLWSILHTASRVVPASADHPGQATLVATICQLRDKHSKGTFETSGGRDQHVWRDLPFFQERWADGGRGPLDDSEAQTVYWRNQSAFAARCFEAGLARWDDDAIRVLRKALEGDVEYAGARRGGSSDGGSFHGDGNGDKGCNDDQMYGEDDEDNWEGEDYDDEEDNFDDDGGDNGKDKDDNMDEYDEDEGGDEDKKMGDADDDDAGPAPAPFQTPPPPTDRCNILAATEWIIYSGTTLLRNSTDRDGSAKWGFRGPDDSLAEPGVLFEGPDGLSTERWNFWKAQFKALLEPKEEKEKNEKGKGKEKEEADEVDEGTALTDDVRAAVVLAIERMEQAEVVVAAEEKRELEELARD